jgi:uncharacterized membrane protein YphA (DoxX/SURF4 family)
MPRFRVLSDPDEKSAAYRAYRGQKPAASPEVRNAGVRGADPSSHPIEEDANRAPHRLAGLRESWSATGSWASRTGIEQKLRLLGDMIADLLSDEDFCRTIRQLVMRCSLGLVLAWFAVQQVYDPSDWVHFVPSFMQGPAGVPEELLIRLHGTLLLVASAGLLTGAWARQAAGLAAVLLVQIIAALVISGGEGGLVARDVGLVGLALAVVLDPLRPARELPAVPVSEPPLRQQVRGRLPIAARSANGSEAAYASGTRAASRTAVKQAGPSRNGDAPLSNDTRSVAGGSYFSGELKPGDRDRTDEHAIRLTETMVRLTWLIGGLVLVNLISVLVNALTA